VPVYPVAYSFFRLPATAAFPQGHVAPRPILQITLVNGSKSFDCTAIMDSGADHCVFPRSFMAFLGLDPLLARVALTSGLGSTSVPTYFTPISIDLQGIVQFPVYAGFTAGLEQLGFGLLGQTGFFDRFNVGFRLSQKTCYIEVPDPPKVP
jgi:hypothetical protein